MSSKASELAIETLVIGPDGTAVCVPSLVLSPPSPFIANVAIPPFGPVAMPLVIFLLTAVGVDGLLRATSAKLTLHGLETVTPASSQVSWAFAVLMVFVSLSGP